MLFTFSNLTAVWISRNYEDKIINDHLPCYSPPLTSLFVMSFLVCRGNYCAWSNRFCCKNIGFLNICPPTAFIGLFVIKVMALVQGRNMVYPGLIDPYFLAVIMIPEPHFSQNFDPCALIKKLIPSIIFTQNFNSDNFVYLEM